MLLRCRLAMLLLAVLLPAAASAAQSIATAATASPVQALQAGHPDGTGEKNSEKGGEKADEAAAVPEVRELWTGKMYTSTYRAGLCMPATGDGDIRGVLLLRLSSGTVDVYHFKGRTEGGVITLRHNSGHQFTGQLDTAAEVSGKIRLKNGYTVELKGQRQDNADLSADTCRPQPQ